MVSIAACADYNEKTCEAAVRQAVEAAGGLDWVTPGMKIGVKANLVSMLKPSAAATTHPELICALIRLLKERGADVIVGDSPGGLFNAVYVNRVYSATGMRACIEAGAALNEDYSCKEARFEAAKQAKRFEYTAWLDSCDAIINFCKLKTHGMVGMSAAVKNLFGTIPGTRKPEMHYQFPEAADFADMLVDLNEYFRPRLTLVDAVTGMEGNGPTMGTPRNVGCVIAGQSPYEVDEVCARIIGIDETAAPTLAAARRRGLSCGDVKIAGDIAPFLQTDWDLPPRRDLRFVSKGPLGKVVASVLQARPTVKKKLCVGCAKCKEVCPASAITMKNKRPVIDRKVCIRCFCCQEFCPKAAMVSHRSAIARLLNK